MESRFSNHPVPARKHLFRPCAFWEGRWILPLLCKSGQARQGVHGHRPEPPVNPEKVGNRAPKQTKAEDRFAPTIRPLRKNPLEHFTGLSAWKQLSVEAPERSRMCSEGGARKGMHRRKPLKPQGRYGRQQEVTRPRTSTGCWGWVAGPLGRAAARECGGVGLGEGEV